MTPDVGMIGMNRMATVLATVFLASTFAGTAKAGIKTQWVDYTQGDTALRGYLAYDDSIPSRRPGLLLVHRYDGMSELTLQNAQMIARQGYVVFAADIFGRDVHPKDVPEMVAQSSIYNNDRPLMRARAQAGLDVLRGNAMVDPAQNSRSSAIASAA